MIEDDYIKLKREGEHILTGSLLEEVNRISDAFIRQQPEDFRRDIDFLELCVALALLNRKSHVNVTNDHLFSNDPAFYLNEQRVENEEQLTQQVLEIFSFWKDTFNKPKATLDAKRAGLISKALIQYEKTVEECKLAIIGKSRDQNGTRPGGKIYDSIDLIFRDADHIERYIEDGKPKQLDELELRICVLCSLESEVLSNRDFAEVKRVSNYLREKYKKAHPDQKDQWYHTAVGEYARWHFDVFNVGRPPFLGRIISNWERFVTWARSQRR